MLTLLEQLWIDVRFGIRSFRRTPALSCLALLSLALGVGSATAIFSAVYSVILDPFPYGDSKHLLSLQIYQPGDGQARFGFSSDQFLDVAADAKVFDELSGSVWTEVALTGNGEPERLDGVLATANIFKVLSVRPLLGRGFTEADVSPSAPASAVLSYKCWQRVFAGDPAIIGKEIRINDQLRTVVGVTPERVYWIEADVYLPVTFQRDVRAEHANGILMLGRLKKGVAHAEAEASLQAAFSPIAKREPTQFPGQWQSKALPFAEAFPSTIQKELWMLLAAVGLLLMIACANVSSLLVSKASGREKEMAIRSTLGAGRKRIVRQLLTESVLLAAAGCGLGLLFASQGLRFLIAIVPPDTIPSEAKIGLNTPVLLFAAGIAFVTAILAGLAPALHSSRGQLAASLRENGRGAVGNSRQIGIRETMVVAEVALSLILLVAASLMLRTLFALQQVPLGIKTASVLTLNLPLPGNRYKNVQERVAAVDRFLRAMRQTPGVISAGVNTNPHPFENARTNVEIIGKGDRNAHNVIIHQTDEQYLETLQIPLRTGRLWTEAEVLGKRRLAIVNERFARLYLQDRSPLSSSLQMPQFKTPSGEMPFQIIGVVSDVINQGLAKKPAPEVYVPYTLSGASQRFILRTVSDPMSVSRAILTQIRQVDSQQPVTDLMSMENALSRRLFSLSRFELILFGIFAAVGLVLAVAGIYGVVSNNVKQRTRELGLRLALGAQPYQVIGLVLRSGMRLVTTGVLVGLFGALLVTRFMAGFVFGATTTDPLSFGAVMLVLTAVGFVACLWPACMSAKIDPMRSLRQE